MANNSRPLGQQFDGIRKGLMAESEGMDVEDRDFVQSALRLAGTGHTGPINAMDADVIERTQSAHARLNDYGFPSSLIGSKSPRGLSVDIGTEHQVSVTPNSGPGYHVSIRHPDRYAEGRPAGWGEHDQTLNVDEHDLPGALMDHIADPTVRRKAAIE